MLIFHTLNIDVYPNISRYDNFPKKLSTLSNAANYAIELVIYSIIFFSLHHKCSLVIETFVKVCRPRPRLLVKVLRSRPRLYAKVSRPRPYRKVSRATINDKKCQVEEFTVVYA